MKEEKGRRRKGRQESRDEGRSDEIDRGKEGKREK